MGLRAAALICGLGVASAFSPALRLHSALRSRHYNLRGASCGAFRPAARAKILPGQRVRAPRSLALCMNADLVVEEGDVVGVTYKGTLDDGSVFDENPDGPPLEFEVGAGRVIRGFDDAVLGLKINEKRTVKCPPENAYGDIDPTNVAEVPKDQMPQPPEGMSMDVGMVLQLSTGQIAVVKEIKDDTVVLDGNHPLAGKTLNFEVTLNYVADRDKVLQDKLKEVDTILNNPLFALIAKEMTKSDDYVAEAKKRLADAGDNTRAVLQDIVRSEEWISITAAIMSNPQLQAMMSDPQSVEKIMNGRALRALPLFAPLSVRCKASRFCSDILSRNAYALTQATSGLALCLVRVSCVYCAQGRSKHRKCQQRSPPPPPTSRI